jgi:cytochrome P450
VRTVVALTSVDSIPAFPPRRTDPFAPPPKYGQWRDRCPVQKVRFPNGQEVWAITTHEGVREILAQHDLENLTANRYDPEFPALRAGVTGSPDSSNVLFTDEPEHGRLRRMLAPVFTHKKAMQMREGVQESVDRALDEMIAAGSPCDLHTTLSLVVPSMVICQLLGVGYEHHPFFQSVTEKLLSRDTPREEFQSLLASLHRFVTEIVEAKAADPNDDDLIGHMLLTHEAKGEITRGQIAGMGMHMVVAGHETTATTISMTLVQLLRTGQWDELVADPTLAPKFVEECIRTQSIADNTLLRLAARDFELQGHTIRAGERVVGLMAAANHDPAVFPDPTRIDPSRQNLRQHVGLGHGVHVCLGQNIARVELDVVFQTLARRLPTIRLDVPEEDLDWKHDGFVFGVREVPVRW